MRATAKTTLFLLLVLSLVPCRADENDIRHKRGDGLNNDGAAYYGDQKTKQQLTPDMMGHYAQASMYFATGNIPMGTMEQMKGDMLKQQIQVNQQSADKNRDSEKKATEEDGPPMQGGKDPNVITVDKDRQSAGGGGGGGGSSSSSGDSLTGLPPVTSSASPSGPSGASGAPAAGTSVGAEIMARQKSSGGTGSSLAPGDGSTTAVSAASSAPVAPDASAGSPPSVSTSASAPIAGTSSPSAPTVVTAPSAAPGAPAGDGTAAAGQGAPSDSDPTAGAVAKGTDWRQDLDGVTKGQGNGASSGGVGEPQARLLGALPTPPRSRMTAAKRSDDEFFAAIGKSYAADAGRGVTRHRASPASGKASAKNPASPPPPVASR